MLYLGIDHGIQRTRAAVFSLEANTVLSEATVEYSQEADRAVEQDPSAWIRAVDTSVQECLDRLGSDRKRLAGLAVSSSRLGWVLLNGRNQILHPTKVWGPLEARNSRQELSRRFGGRPGVIELLGRPFHVDSASVYLFWLKQQEPGLFERLATIFQPQEFINFWLTGVRRAEYSGGAETGLMDVRQRIWRKEVTGAIDERLSKILPELRSSDEVAGGLRPEIAQAWGVPDHLLVAAGGTRAAMDLMGAGVINPGETLIRLGEEGSLRIVLEEPVEDPSGKLIPGCDGADQWLLSFECCRCGALVEEVKVQTGWDDGQFERVAASVAPGAGGLSYLPGMTTEKVREATLHGVREGNLSSPNLARAAMEATVFELGQGLTHAQALGVKPTRLKVVGESGVGSAWRQVLADVFGLGVASSSALSSPAVGAALQAAVVFYHASGENLSYTEVAEYALPVGEEEWVYPDQERNTLYRELLQDYGYLKEQMAGLAHHA